YNYALRDAFETFQYMGYVYQPNANILAKASTQTTASVEEQKEIARLKEEIKSLKEEKVESVEVIQPVVVIPVIEESTKGEISKESNVAKSDVKEIKSEVLYAQSIENGFQIVDSTPKVVMTLLPTAAKDVFTVKNKNAIV